MELFWGFYSVPTPFFRKKGQENISVMFWCLIEEALWLLLASTTRFKVVDELYIYYKIRMYSETC
jgi:hypothetical protein